MSIADKVAEAALPVGQAARSKAFECRDSLRKRDVWIRTRRYPNGPSESSAVEQACEGLDIDRPDLAVMRQILQRLL